MRKDVAARIKASGVIPILRTPSADDALAIAEILMKAGLVCVEIPLTVPGALEVIAELASSMGKDVLIGAGTVLTPEEAAQCLGAGARFIVTPALNVATVKFCVERDLAIYPGGLTPTEVVTAWQAGADAVKVFPASAVGGAPYLRALKAPLPDIDLVPTGGVTIDNAASFIEAGAAAVGVGSDFVDLEALHGGRSEVIAERARRYLSAVAMAR